ncbi:MAG: DNA starvation/stationary phase protection protein Dps [Planctomycetota bacterium]
MYQSPSSLAPEARTEISQALNVVLTDGIDLQTQIKVAHWNIKGPQFPGLHPLFDTFAQELSLHNDGIAERVVTLGALAVGTARHVAANSSLSDYPQDVTRDQEHVKLLASRFESYLASLRKGRAVAEKHGDDDTVDQLTAVVQAFEKHAWFLRASQAD